MPNDVDELLLFPFRWILLQLLSPFRFFLEFISLFMGHGHVERPTYKPYVGKYWGQFWTPRSEREYSKHTASLELRPADQLQLPPLSTLVPSVANEPS